jgi:L-cystine uptake protein TcyP (sodium:dicarboxylate symporter family)
MTNNIFIYLLVGITVGVLIQLTTDKAQNITDQFKEQGLELEDMPKFTVLDHLKIIVIWPFVILVIITEILKTDFSDSSKK